MSLGTSFRKFVNPNCRRYFSALPNFCKITMCKSRVLDHRSKRNLMTATDESSELMNIWPDVVGDLMKINTQFNVPSYIDHVVKVLEYNVPYGKKLRSRTFIDTYKMLVPSCTLTNENLRRARIVGWCIELSHAYAMVENDIVDQAQFRRGKQCWHLKENVGLAAINDGQILEEALFQLLKMHFRTEPYYVSLMEEFAETLNTGVTGQCLDSLLSRKPINFDKFTMDKCVTLANCKTAYYTFVQTFKLAMVMSGIGYTEEYKKAEKVMKDMGIYYQFQDDYLDYHEKTTTTGKSGRDIEEGKCTWAIVVALEHASPKQREILEKCYGVDEPEKKEEVLKVYEELQLPKLFSAYEEKEYNCIKKSIKSLAPHLSHDHFLGLLNQIHQRNT